MISKVPKGRHTGFRFPKRVKQGIKCKVRFTESCRYDHKGHDQLDWNKLIGIKDKFFKPMYNSVMVAWRYNLKTNTIDLTDYIHLNGERFIGTELKSVSIGEWFDVELGNPYKKGWRIINWFGGTKKAPHKIEIEYEMG